MKKIKENSFEELRDCVLFLHKIKPTFTQHVSELLIQFIASLGHNALEASIQIEIIDNLLQVNRNLNIYCILLDYS